MVEQFGAYYDQHEKLFLDQVKGIYSRFIYHFSILRWYTSKVNSVSLGMIVTFSITLIINITINISGNVTMVYHCHCQITV